MALYRKYRPATFAEVVGQEHVTDPLSIALDTGRISHAYLFSGPRGCGKTSSARILARSLNCVEGPTSTPCGVCSSCVALGPGGSGNLDVIELDAASHGGVDDTRELRDRAFYAPAESRYRVFIVDEAHMVTTAGFNALLKIVEEPPAHLIFVFATTEPEKVLPTIRSRTHHYPFRLLPPATMRGLLGKICEQEHVEVEESVYPLVIRAGGGSPRDSLSVLDQLLAGAGPEGVTYPRAVSLLGVTDVALIDDAVDALANSDGASLFGTIDRVVEAGHDPRRFATDLLERLRDLILLRAVPDATERNLVTGPGDVLARMRDQAARLGPATLARHAELLHEGLGDMRGATAPRLLLEVVAARMLLPAASDAETATLQRLETLERRMAGGAIPQSAPAAPAPERSAPASDSDPSPASAPSTPPTGAPRRRGAEALAALRENRPGTTPPVPQQQQAAPPPQPPQAAVSPQPQAVVQPEPAPAQQTSAPVAAVRPPEMNAVRGPVADAETPASPVSSTETVAVQGIADIAAGPDGSAADIPLPGLVAEEDLAAAAAAKEAAARAAEAAAAQGGSADSAGAAGSAQLAVAEPEATEPEIDPDQMALGMDEPDGASADELTPAFAFAAQSVDVATASEVVAQLVADSEAEVDPQAAAEVAAPMAEPEPVAAEVVSLPDQAAEPELIPEPEPVAAVSEPVAPVAGGDSSEDVLREIEAAWADIRAKVREFGAAVQALLSGASVSRLEGGTIVFAHQHAPLAQRLSQPANLDAVRSAVKAVLGREHDVKWEVGSGTAPAAPQASAGGAGKGPAAGAGAAPKKAAAKFSRPSQAKAATASAATTVAAPAAWGSPATAPGTAGDGVAPGTAGDAAAGGSGFGGSAQGGSGAAAGGAGTAAAGAQARGGNGGAGVRNAPPEDDIPLPDGPDYPDDPGPSDYSPVGYDGVPPATTDEEERELLAAAAVPIPAEERRDPDDVALELLRSELGATPLEG
ncbi:DNA polymerase III subunit gamma and tau [Nocardia sp. NPDC056000]|uniref:DNA polymerase III subunit gamma and tau n=1 Tax=Nocardia sp. NPDC056000 TaxID=3345674 RepID=UPI0035E0B624